MKDIVIIKGPFFCVDCLFYNEQVDTKEGAFFAS